MGRDEGVGIGDGVDPVERVGDCFGELTVGTDLDDVEAAVVNSSVGELLARPIWQESGRTIFLKILYTPFCPKSASSRPLAGISRRSSSAVVRGEHEERVDPGERVGDCFDELIVGDEDSGAPSDGAITAVVVSSCSWRMFSETCRAPIWPESGRTIFLKILYTPFCPKSAFSRPLAGISRRSSSGSSTAKASNLFWSFGE